MTHSGYFLLRNHYFIFNQFCARVFKLQFIFMVKILIALIILLLTLPLLPFKGSDLQGLNQNLVAFADDDEDENGDEENNGDEEDEGEDTDIDDDIAELEAEDDEDEFEIEIEDADEGDEFEIAGTIASISGTSFVVSGQTITIDISKVEKFEQKGILSVGNSVKVEGVIVDGQKFAQEIKVFGTGGKNIKVEIKNAPNKVKVEAKGPLDQIIIFLKQIFSF